MNAASEFDLGPLTWVKGEIDSALERAAEALGQFRDGNDATKIRFCRNHVHQVHGALAIVGLDGVTQVTEAVESLLLSIEEDKTPASAENLAAIEQAMTAIRQFLDDLMAGEPNQPLRLLPVYRVISCLLYTSISIDKPQPLSSRKTICQSRKFSLLMIPQPSAFLWSIF